MRVGTRKTADQLNAALAGAVDFGGDLTVNRLGFGAILPEPPPILDGMKTERGDVSVSDAIGTSRSKECHRSIWNSSAAYRKFGSMIGFVRNATVLQTACNEELRRT